MNARSTLPGIAERLTITRPVSFRITSDAIGLRIVVLVLGVRFVVAGAITVLVGFLTA